MIKRNILLICLSLAGIVGLSGQSKGATMYVAVKSADLKNGTGLFAAKSGSVLYGDQVTVLEVSGSKVQVKSGSATGWITTSSLTTKRIVSSGGTATASTKELALAGKGFSDEVEQNYKDSTDLDYSQVDAMENLTVSDSDLEAFLTEGHLKKE
ncbi:MAG: hypothetical protein LBG90_05755 [Spirochaetaceae bacterium]|nr:hypothetical protein [Spirochaetaceae bacterium]